MTSVTAIVAAYNAEPFIQEALRSALAQDHDGRLDVLVVDDGSTDCTAAAVDAIARQAPGRVRLIRQANAGNGAAINAALPLVDGDVVAFLDADDVWPADKLRRQLPALVPGVGLVYGDMAPIDATGTPLAASWLGLVCPGEPPRGRCFGRLLEVGAATSSSILMPTALARAVGAIPPGVPPDWWLSLRAAQRAEIAYVAEPRTLYRHHGGNQSLGSGDATLREAHLRRARLQRWFLRRMELGQASTAEVAAAWAAFERNIAESLQLAGSPFAASLVVTEDDREEARLLAADGGKALRGGDLDAALVLFARAAAADPWHADARDGMRVAAPLES
jgi:glycosyltransferase involved in cell wall biosynthesis